MKELIKRYIPRTVKKQLLKGIQLLKLRKNFKQDMKKFIKHSFIFGDKKVKRHYEADLIFYYHKIEKGLSLPSPRVGFGKKNVLHLLNKLEEYITNYGWDDVASVSLNTLYEYYNFNKANNLELNDLNNKINELRSTQTNNVIKGIGGVEELRKQDIDKSNIDFKGFAYSRYSIRNFAPGEVSDETIKEAVEIAQKTPSVCNRQSSKVYVYGNEENKRKVLKFQNGNTGFGHTADKILIVTTDLKDFRGIIERNQGYIDGGMYSMSLIYALHSLGVGTCPLNLSITNEIEKNLKETAKIPESEILLMMIAVGNIPDKLKVASSPRRDATEVLTIN